MRCKDLLWHRRPGRIVEDGINVSGGAADVTSIAANYQRIGSTARHLQCRRTVAMRVIRNVPEGLVDRDVDFVFEFRVRSDVEQYVIAISCWRHT